MTDHPRGLYCIHDQRIMVPGSDEPYAPLVWADPYPCADPRCTPAVVQAEQEEEAAQNDAEQWRDYYRDIAL